MLLKLLTTNHSAFDVEFIQKHSGMIVDMRNMIAESNDKVCKLETDNTSPDPQGGTFAKTNEVIGKTIDNSTKREKVFMTTKVSGYTNMRNNLYREIYDSLLAGKQEHYQKKAAAMRAARNVDKPGYFITYWPGQPRSFEGTYLSNAMAADYAHKVEGSPKFKEFILKSVEESLKRVGTGYFDILMCPHGAGSYEEVQIEETFTTFEKLKRDGKVRFLGVSTHNDPAGVLRAARETARYDVAMVAYNIINGGYMEREIELAKQSGMGIIAMKAAMAVATQHEALKPIPGWRIQKVERMVPGNMKPPVKAYLWALQNSNISAVISNLWDEQHVNENLSVIGKKSGIAAGLILFHSIIQPQLVRSSNVSVITKEIQVAVAIYIANIRIVCAFQC